MRRLMDTSSDYQLKAHFKHLQKLRVDVKNDLNNSNHLEESLGLVPHDEHVAANFLKCSDYHTDCEKNLNYFIV